jgi:hypothetical protein
MDARSKLMQETPLHPQLAAIKDLLAAHNVSYFIDSGTLIGILRENRVLSHDKDIDLGVWEESIPKMEALVPSIVALGYSAHCNEYGGLRYSYKFVPTDPGGLILSIGVYRDRGGQAWRMAMFGTDNPHPPGSPAFYLKGAIRTPLRHVAQMYRRFAGTSRVVGRWPWRHVLQVGTWIVPSELIRETKTHQPTGLPIPKRSEEYLGFRYGDWRTPVNKWLWYRDDLAVHLGPPDKVLPGALQEA